jgi:hypothetical protein
VLALTKAQRAVSPYWAANFDDLLSLRDDYQSGRFRIFDAEGNDMAPAKGRQVEEEAKWIPGFLDFLIGVRKAQKFRG